MSRTKIAIAGALGRMGNNLINSALSNNNVELVGVFDVKDIDSSFINKNQIQENVFTTREESFEKADIVIDFTTPKALFNFTEAAVSNNTGLVIGTTGLDESHFNLLKQTSNSTKVFYAPNMSYGVNTFFEIARKASKHLKDFDIEIIETHHRHKKDAPSGTALKLGEEIVEELGLSKSNFNFKRQDQEGQRKENEIGFSSIRGGNIPGEHTVIFHGDNESIELTHKAHNRKIFSDGAIQAAVWLSSKEKGFYTFKDMIS